MNHEKAGTRALISSIFMTVSFLALLPTGLRLAATFRIHSFEIAENHYMVNHMAPMGFAILAFIGVGVIVAWTDFRRARLSAWFVLSLIAWVFYFPVWIRSRGLDWGAFTLDWILTPGMQMEVLTHRLGFGFMLFALMLNAFDCFEKFRNGGTKARPLA